MDNQQATQLLGKLGMFLGTYSRGWSDAQFAAAAKNARAMGVDTLYYKVADGGQAWYNAARVKSIRQAMLAEGAGAVPFHYQYGTNALRHWDISQVDDEARIALAAQEAADGVVCLDMEAEYNGQVQAAERLAHLMAGHGTLLISTWADPMQQNWAGVVAALAPATQVWMPQQYTRWLVGQEQQLVNLHEGIIQPTFDLSGEFDRGNDPLANAHTAVSRGHSTISLWEYNMGVKNPNLVRSIASVMGNGLTNAKPVKLPAPSPKPTSPAAPVTQATRHTYTIKSGDSLAAIAEKVGLPNWYQDLFLPNKARLDAAARAKGKADSDGGNLIFPPTTLVYYK